MQCYVRRADCALLLLHFQKILNNQSRIATLQRCDWLSCYVSFHGTLQIFQITDSCKMNIKAGVAVVALRHVQNTLEKIYSSVEHLKLTQLWPNYNYYLQGKGLQEQNRWAADGESLIVHINSPSKVPKSCFSVHYKHIQEIKSLLEFAAVSNWYNYAAVIRHCDVELGSFKHTDSRKAFPLWAYSLQSDRDGNSKNNPHIMVTDFGLWHYLPVHTDLLVQEIKSSASL